MKNRKSGSQQKRDEQYGLFGQIVTCSVGGAILASLFYNSVVPLVIVTIGLFSIMSFMNGLS